MAIFILAQDRELHADRIEWALKECGIEVIRWSGLGWQPQDGAAIHFGGEDTIYLGDRRIGPQDTLWLKRPSVISHPQVDEGEAKFAQAEYTAFQRTLMMSLEFTGAFCVNKWSAARRIENKSVQLFLAKRCGLRVPSTMMSNRSRSVLDFLDQPGADIVHKTYLAHGWIEADGTVYSCETARIDRSDSFPEETFSYAPGIYQQRIPKEFDVRINMLNRDFHAYKLTTPDNALDWRSHGLTDKLRAERFSLPAAIELKLRQFADEADIVFGCFDMVVDAEGRWWFLEVNQTGQFLWIDDLLPDDGVFQPMLKLLSARERVSNRPFPTYRECVSGCPPKNYFVPVDDSLPFLTTQRSQPQSAA